MGRAPREPALDDACGPNRLALPLALRPRCQLGLWWTTRSDPSGAGASISTSTVAHQGRPSVRLLTCWSTSSTEVIGHRLARQAPTPSSERLECGASS